MDSNGVIKCVFFVLRKYRFFWLLAPQLRVLLNVVLDFTELVNFPVVIIRDFFLKTETLDDAGRRLNLVVFNSQRLIIHVLKYLKLNTLLLLCPPLLAKNK